MNPFFENKEKINILHSEINAINNEFESFRQSICKKTDKKFRKIKRLEKQCTHRHQNGKSAMFRVKNGLVLSMRYNSADWDECRLCGHQRNIKYNKKLLGGVIKPNNIQ